MAKRIDPRVEIGPVHLSVANLERALAFYQGVLGFELAHRVGDSAAFLSVGDGHHLIGLNTWQSRRGGPPASGGVGPYHFAIRYPDRPALGDALRRLQNADVPLEGSSDHGVTEALYLRDPDGNGLELYRERPRSEWPRNADRSIQARSEPLDLAALLAAAASPAAADPSRPPAHYEPMSEKMRQSLRDLRGRLLQLHKVLLDDARAAYEMDRGRVGSTASLLQLVINDPWFAWLHSVSELVVRIDETAEPDSPATAADAAALTEQVDRLLTASEHGEGFQRRYFDALQRQPAVVLAHADVNRVLKAMR